MRLVNATITVRITGPAGCGKTVLADKIAQVVADDGDTIIVVDEYRPSWKWKEREKQAALASKPDVLVLVTETNE